MCVDYEGKIIEFLCCVDIVGINIVIVVLCKLDVEVVVIMFRICCFEFDIGSLEDLCKN